jgi:hypothetical protein
MYLVLYALTHNAFIFSLMCLGSGAVCISWFVFFADFGYTRGVASFWGWWLVVLGWWLGVFVVYSRYRLSYASSCPSQEGYCGSKHQLDHYMHYCLNCGTCYDWLLLYVHDKCH